jgi:PAS domain S-box-containing protein
MADESKTERLAELGRLRQRVAELEEELGLSPSRPPETMLDERDSDEVVPPQIARDLSDLLSLHTPSGDYVYVSPNTERFFGWTRESILGRNAYDLFHPDDLERIAASHAEHEEQTSRNSVRYRIRNADGTYHWVETRSRAHVTGEGVEYIVAVTRDIDEEVEAEQDLRQFTRIVSHDLRSPLVAVANLVEWLEEDVGDDLPSESARHLQLIGERVDRLRVLLEDLLTYARVGITGLEPKRVDVVDLVHEIRDSLDIRGDFDVRFSVEDGAPTSIETGRAPLRQVLANLIQNAVTHHDADDGCVTVRMRDDGRRVEFCVTDDGPGVPERYQEKVFEMFKTLKHSDESEGTGVGLALVDRIVSTAGGSIRLESPIDDGRGSRFCFDWPRQWSEWEGRDVRT